MEKIEDINILAGRPLITPASLKTALPVSEKAAQAVFEGRQKIRGILDGSDPRLFVIVGPCSIHNTAMAMEYAGRLRELAGKVSHQIVIIMRVYFEKPRTNVGWKGFITDPRLNDSFDIEYGLMEGRKLLLDIAELGLPTATEFVDPIIPQYFAELISWTAIGARTTESQKHREMASGLSSPVGFKNNTDGSLDSALNALISAAQSHQFLGIDNQGDSCILTTRGNPHGHIVLRGGKEPNYTAPHIIACEKALEQAGMRKNVVVDCSHGNSRKDYTQQPHVFQNCLEQILEGNRSIVGLMLESNLQAGNQKIPKDLSQLIPGVSITDACIDWKITEELLLKAGESLAENNNKTASMVS